MGKNKQLDYSYIVKDYYIFNYIFEIGYLCC